MSIARTPEAQVLIKAISRDIPSEKASDLLYAFYTAVRAEVLREAINAARGEYLTDNTGTNEDNAYDGGVSDVIAAIGELSQGAAVRSAPVRRSAVRSERTPSGVVVRWREDGKARRQTFPSRREAEQFMQYLADGGAS